MQGTQRTAGRLAVDAAALTPSLRPLRAQNRGLPALKGCHLAALNLLPPDEGVGQGAAVHHVQLAAERHAMGDTGGADTAGGGHFA